MGSSKASSRSLPLVPGLPYLSLTVGLDCCGERALCQATLRPTLTPSVHKSLDIVCSKDLGPILGRDAQPSLLGGRPAGPSPGGSKHLPQSWELFPSRPEEGREVPRLSKGQGRREGGRSGEEGGEGKGGGSRGREGKGVEARVSEREHGLPGFWPQHGVSKANEALQQEVCLHPPAGLVCTRPAPQTAVQSPPAGVLGKPSHPPSSQRPRGPVLSRRPGQRGWGWPGRAQGSQWMLLRTANRCRGPAEEVPRLAPGLCLPRATCLGCDLRARPGLGRIRASLSASHHPKSAVSSHRSAFIWSKKINVKFNFLLRAGWARGCGPPACPMSPQPCSPLTLTYTPS